MFCENLLAGKRLPEIWEKESGPWEIRRKEVTDILQRELFGYRPADPEEISFEEVENSDMNSSFCAGKAVGKKIAIHTKLNGKEFTFPIYAAIPKGEGKFPFFVHINFRDNVPDKYMPTEELIDNGFAVFSFGYQDVTSDDDDFTNGLAGLIYEGRERVGSECGKIPMWSWAASRVMDYCQSLDCLDFNKSAVIGHSRLGKTALFTGMLDERFQFVISNNSGFAGAAFARNREDREQGKSFCSVEFCCNHHMQWFAPNYRKYINNEDAMPYDHHFLVAASAPRYVYVGSAVEDVWSDPDTEYLSCCAAGEVYERMGYKGFIHPDRLPQPLDVFGEGRVGYHMRYGQHYLSREDWNLYMKFIRSKE